MPLGKRLVIELASIKAWIPINSKASAHIYVTLMGSTVKYSIPLGHQRTGSLSQHIYAGTQQMKIYADPGTEVQVFVEATRDDAVDSYSNVSFQASIAGYLVDILEF